MNDIMIDTEARERIITIETVLWGPNKDNGLRSEVKTLNEVVAHMQTEMRHYVDTQSERCLGLKALAEHEQSEGQLYDEAVEGDSDVKVATINGRTELKKAKWSVVATAIGAALLLFGQVITTMQSSATQKSLAQFSQVLETVVANERSN